MVGALSFRPGLKHHILSSAPCFVPAFNAALLVRLRMLDVQGHPH